MKTTIMIITIIIMKQSDHYVRQKAYYLRRVQSHRFYDVLLVLIANDRSFQVFGRHLKLIDTLGLDLMLVSIRCQINLDHLKLLYGEFQKCEVITMSVAGGQPNKHANPSSKVTKHTNGLQF